MGNRGADERAWLPRVDPVAPAFQHLSDMWAPGNGVQMLIQKATLNTVTCSHTAACSVASAQE
jgi:hypothetical protein